MGKELRLQFFGNLYHLNAEEEPEDPDYPKDPEFKKLFGPRGVLHSWADGKGGQKVEDTGPQTKKRMETIDDEVTERALRFIDEAHKSLIFLASGFPRPPSPDQPFLREPPRRLRSDDPRSRGGSAGQAHGRNWLSHWRQDTMAACGVHGADHLLSRLRQARQSARRMSSAS